MDIINYFDALKFLASDHFAYSASEDIVNYDPEKLESDLGRLNLLHEISHCLLGHIDYDYDLELLIMEVKAWNKTRELAPIFKIKIDEDYITTCIESYDLWVSSRATCPECDNFNLQQKLNEFRCFNCQTRWRVNKRKDKRVTRTIIHP
ncbi:MAG: hypothetical protein Q8P54_02290 [bacterium]|nr:hypothetical protein [bacterium]